MPARHSETSAGPSDDSETPGDKGQGHHISESNEAPQPIKSGIESRALSEPDTLGASSRVGSVAAVESRCTGVASSLALLKHLRRNAFRFKVEPRLTCKLSSCITVRTEVRIVAKKSALILSMSADSFVKCVHQSAPATSESFQRTSGDVSPLGTRDSRATRPRRCITGHLPVANAPVVTCHRDLAFSPISRELLNIRQLGSTARSEAGS